LSNGKLDRFGIGELHRLRGLETTHPARRHGICPRGAAISSSTRQNNMSKHRHAVLFALACGVASAALAAPAHRHQTDKAEHGRKPAQHAKAPTHARKSTPHPKTAHIDRSGKPRKGMASYYNGKGKKMADGKRFDPQAKTAASKTLPLGTKARVTNLDTGKSATVEVRDRGPYVDGRIVDVTPRVAQDLGMKKDGVAPVEVKPVELPPPDKDTEAAR
jgi:rare lipoprotein A